VPAVAVPEVFNFGNNRRRMLTRSPGLLDRAAYPNAAVELVEVPPLAASADRVA
jgi:hypothetical protein